MPAQLTTIKNKHDEPKQPLVVTGPSDSRTFYDLDDDSLQHPDDSDNNEHQSQHPNNTTTHMEADTQAGFLDYPPRQGAPSPDDQPGPSTKVEFQGTNESFISVSPFTPSIAFQLKWKWRSKQSPPIPIIPVTPNYEIAKTPLDHPAPPVED